MFKLGQKLRDRVTGFEGIATSRLEYLNGCIQYGIKPQAAADGKMPDSCWIDEEQLELVDEGIAVRQRPGGGDMADTPSGTYRG